MRRRLSIPARWRGRLKATIDAFAITVLSRSKKAAMVAFSRPLQRAGMLSRRLMLRAAWGQLVYQMWGATPEKLEKLRESVLALTKGWDQVEISEIVRDALGAVIEPIVY